MLLSLIGSFLLSKSFAYKNGIPCNYIDALFTSVSAVCVTGLSTLSMDIYSRTGFIIIMLLIEFGGLGIITFVSFYIALPAKKVSIVNRKLIRDFFIDDIEYRPRRILKRILTYTLIIQLIGFILLMCGLYLAKDENFIFNALFISISAFCNAGFSTMNNSLSGFAGNKYILSVIMILIILGGIGFAVITNLVQKIKSFFYTKKEYISVHTKIVILTTLFLIITGAVYNFIFEFNYAFNNLPLPQKILNSLFQSITLRTAGFETLPQNKFAPPSTLLHIVFMFIGGSSGSIAGGVKTTTVFIAFLYAFNGDEEANAVIYKKRQISAQIVNKSITIISRSFIILFCSIFLLALAENVKLTNGTFSSIDIIFECTSAFATVGLSRGITGELNFAAKIIIILTMFIGRTGVFAMALKINKSKNSLNTVSYPKETVMVG
ncbi:TrkH family potassium uptake protein [Treponema pedis]|uniref:TrkH family potassium uptake protein n=1 Tax=Treponema pedis TaxID=409322 RepID=UPI0021F2F79E|nr:potassium transporter TrkG [Treponema pedis]